LKGHEKFFVSTAHSDDDIDDTIEVIRDAVSKMSDSRSGTGA
jgi:glutamate-1-semialdehyde aminotransferase